MRHALVVWVGIDRCWDWGGCRWPRRRRQGRSDRRWRWCGWWGGGGCCDHADPKLPDLRHDGGWLLEPGGGILKDDLFPASHPPPHHTPCIAESGMSFSQPTIYLFQCSNNQRRYGATPDKAGTNLPALGCPAGPFNAQYMTRMARIALMPPKAMRCRPSETL